MGLVGFSALTLCLALGAFQGVQGAVFFLAVPTQLHYDAEYLATVTAFGIEEPEQVLLEYESFNSKYVGPINSTTLSFRRDGVQTWGVTFSWRQMHEMNENMLNLVMTSLRSGRRVTKKLTFSLTSGYIFIQTDKPLYTPGQTVKFRVLAVDEHQKLAQYPVKVDILNDQKIVVDRMRYSPEEAFTKQEFELPREAKSGNWYISAVYEGPGGSNGAKQTVTFEVREYVLPQFSSTLSLSEDVITKSTEWLTIIVDSKYIHGRPVIGQAEMRLGVWEEGKGIEYIDYHVVEPLTDGKLRKDIRVSRLLPRGRQFYRTRRLYVAVNVTEAGTLENDTIVDTSCFIAHPYYELSYNKSKSTFKPGFPYVYKMQSRAKSSRPSSWVQAWVAVYAHLNIAGNVMQMYFGAKLAKLNENGEMEWTVDPPANAEKLVFKATILDLKQEYIVYEYEVTKAISKNNEYLHIAMDKHVSKGADGEILLQYTPPPKRETKGFGNNEKITVMILAKGQVIHSTFSVRNSDGRSVVKVPRALYWNLTPTMRVIAFFYSLGETVMDSLNVDTEDICVSELALHPQGGLFGQQAIIEPKDRYTLEIHGGPRMKVGLVAVDTAVFLLNNKQTLTRELMFEELGSHDIGTINGEGEDIEKMLKNSGLTHISLDSSIPYTEEEAREDSIRRLLVNPRKGPSGGLFDYQSHHMVAKPDGGFPVLAEAPPQTVRKYFPESWLFDEFELSGKGRLDVNTTMPDSLTTWSFLAVGISPLGGVCVSKPHEEIVEKMFFVEVRLPYKVTRLEVVKVRIAVYNFREDKVELYGQVSGAGVCFPTDRTSDWNDNGTDFEMAVDRRSTKGIVVKMIPLRSGHLTIRVDVAVKNDPTRDVVEKQLYVEAEGRRVKKTMTFVLDPEAKRSKFSRVKDRMVVLSNTSTISNRIDVDKKMQHTEVNLQMPKEVIKGTEKCRIAAFGDLMGDIIQHAVVQSRSLLDQPVLDAEEVLGDLGPTVHALLYTKQNGLLDPHLEKKGRRFVKHAVSRLLSYRKNSAFSLKPGSKPATWLTALVLKTLCYAEKLAFIEKKNVVDKGFAWLLEQIEYNGEKNESIESINEQDWRLANDSFQYQLMLAADVLIALRECRNEETKGKLWLELEGRVAGYLLENYKAITLPLVLAKAAYALNKHDPKSEAAKGCTNALLQMKRKTNQGTIYWALEPENTEGPKVPFWYHKGAKASSIEATAFALLVFLETSGTNVDAIADWLVAQRNENGAFIGAMDSTAAIQALAMYSRQKHNIKVDLLCNVTSFQIKEYWHSFKFTDKNATRVAAVNNVPVSQTLQVHTTGQGLGQMQVNVEYNVPIDKNRDCPFKVEVEVKASQANMDNLNKGPLCLSCNFGCPVEDQSVLKSSMSDMTQEIHASSVIVEGRRPRWSKSRGQRRQKGRRNKNRNNKNRNRKNPRSSRPRSRKTREATFSIRQHPAASKKVVCFKICLEHLSDMHSGPAVVDIEMLSGYNPVQTDWKMIEDSVPDVKGVEYMEDSAILRVHFYKVAPGEPTCIGFRARDDMEVGRPAPATVVIHQEGIPYPVCALEYKPPQESASLQVYCAEISNIDRGECRCYSGLCGTCRPFQREREPINISELRKYTCDTDIAYHLEMVKWKDANQWFEIQARVRSLNRTGTHEDLNEGDLIKLQTPSSCHCPVGDFPNSGQSFYLLSPDVEVLTDHRGNTQHRYLLDHRSHVLRVSEPGQFQNAEGSPPTVQHGYLKSALSNGGQC